MRTINLTDRAAAGAKAPKGGGRRELWDKRVGGLCLRVSPKGKVWVVRYRTDDGRQPRMILGDYTDRQGLRWAREQAEDVRSAVRRGDDPAADRKAARAAARAQPIRTFEDLADAYLAG